MCDDYHETTVTINAVNMGICKLSFPTTGIASAILQAMAPAVMDMMGWFKVLVVVVVAVSWGRINQIYPIIQDVIKHAIQPLNVAFVVIVVVEEEEGVMIRIIRCNHRI